MGKMLSPLLRLSRTTEDGRTYYTHWCPGCKHAHLLETPRWNFDGNAEKPTFTPSFRHYSPAHTDAEGKHVPEYTFCHYNIDAGVITFHGDCGDHALRGQVPMAEWPYKEGEWSDG